MPRLFVSDIEPQMQIDEVFRIVDRQLRANRQGNAYLLLQLQDKTGTISAMRWNADERLADRHPKGSFVRLQGLSQVHNGILQLIANQLSVVDETKIDLADFESESRVPVDELWAQLLALLAEVQNETLKRLALHLTSDETIAAGLRKAPAGIKTHHAYPGGLLEHIVSLMQLANVVASHYPKLDRDLLVIGAFVHDIGKIEELSFQTEWGYSDSGQLLGHLVQGVQIIDRALAKLAADGLAVDSDTVLRLQHIIVSHHGTLEHGSPKVPMTMEALAFQFLDELDAKLNAAETLILADKTRDTWAPFNPTMGRKLYKPSLKS